MLFIRLFDEMLMAQVVNKTSDEELASDVMLQRIKQNLGEIDNTTRQKTIRFEISHRG